MTFPAIGDGSTDEYLRYCAQGKPEKDKPTILVGYGTRIGLVLTGVGQLVWANLQVISVRGRRSRLPG